MLGSPHSSWCPLVGVTYLEIRLSGTLLPPSACAWIAEACFPFRGWLDYDSIFMYVLSVLRCPLRFTLTQTTTATWSALLTVACLLCCLI
jgi:hypothetical protein